MALSDFVFSATEIGAFEFNQQKKRIWASMTNNQHDSPNSWQFRYDPIFIPEISNNQLSVKSEQWSENAWRTSLTILLDNKEARKLAYQNISKIYPEQAQKIQASSIFTLPISCVKINIPDLKKIAPEATLIDDSFEFAQVSSEFTIRIESPDQDTALKIEESLSRMTLDYEFATSARKSQKNLVRFSLQKLKSSKLFTKLQGFGDVAYVHRDDLRKLLEGIETKVSFDAVIENPEHFEAGLLDQLLTHWNQSQSSKNFDETKWQSTYHQDDLKPDILTKELNKMITKDEKTDQWKFNPSAELDIGSGVLEGVAGKIGGKLYLSNDDLKKLLREQNIEASIEGTKIIAKSIDLCQVNLADFNDQTQLISVVTFVQPSEDTTSKGFIDFSRLLSPTVSDIDVKDKIIENKIIALLGKNSVGKSAILNSLIDADLAETSGEYNLLTICFKSPFVLIDLPRMIENMNYEELAIKKTQKANGIIFVINGEPFQDEIELFDKVHQSLPNISKIVFVNKWDIIQNNKPKKDQEFIRYRISEKMRKFVKSPEDIVYGSAMLFDKERDEMIRQELTQLINKMQEIF